MKDFLEAMGIIAEIILFIIGVLILAVIGLGIVIIFISAIVGIPIAAGALIIKLIMMII